MILRNIHNIRDVIAFPKTQSGADIMSGAPSPIDDKQLKEANIRSIAPVAKSVEPDVHGVVHKHAGGAVPASPTGNPRTRVSTWRTLYGEVCR